MTLAITRYALVFQSQDPAKVGRVVKALMPMKKIDLGKLKEAYEGRA